MPASRPSPSATAPAALPGSGDAVPMMDGAREEVKEAAARWFARAQSGEFTEAEQAELATWRAAQARNDYEYQALERVWAVAGKMDPERLLALADAPRGRRGALQNAMRRHAGMALACVLALGVGAGGWQWYRAQPVFAGSAQTALGERKSVNLPDGSAMELNTGSQLQVTYYRDRRTVSLAAGEASFSVERDPSRPFIVQAGKGAVRVLGTRFNVRRDGDQIAVAVLSGTVEVSGTGQGAAPAVLTAGLAVRIDASGQVGETRNADVAALTAWRDGKLVFDDVPLGEVLREVARYGAKPIRVADAQLERLRLSSTFRINDTDALLQALPRILPVSVRTLPDGSAEIGPP